MCPRVAIAFCKCREEQFILGPSSKSTRRPAKMNRDAFTLYVFSGAGLSAESGLSTFRSADGIWTRNSVEKVCDIRTWRRNRPAVFEFYNDRIREKHGAEPNAAHKLLAKWQNKWGTERVQLLTREPR